MSWHILLMFLATCFVVSGTPGPNMLFALGLGIRVGARRAAWGGAGMCVALAAMAALSALGLGALLTASAAAFQAVKWAGAAYLVWLGLTLWRAPVRAVAARGEAPAGDAAPARLFVQGLFVTLGNPKAFVFLGALFPQFIDPAAALLPQLGILVAVMSVVEFGWIMAYAIGGDALAGRLSSPGAGRLLNRVSGGLLVGAGGLLALARQA